MATYNKYSYGQKTNGTSFIKKFFINTIVLIILTFGLFIWVINSSTFHNVSAIQTFKQYLDQTTDAKLKAILHINDENKEDKKNNNENNKEIMAPLTLPPPIPNEK